MEVADHARRLARENRRAAHLVVGSERRAVGDQPQARVVDQYRALELRAQLLDEGLDLVIARRHRHQRLPEALGQGLRQSSDF
jgi:hypothetical protein